MLFAIIFYACALAAALAFTALYYTHMFQLESYQPAQFCHWLKCMPLQKTAAGVLPALIAALVLFGFHQHTAAYLIGGVLMLVCVYVFRPFKAKKPLVFTARVLRLLGCYAVLSILLCTVFGVLRLPGLTPVVLIASPLLLLLANAVNRPMENAVRNHYIREAKQIIAARRPNLIVIGITGSYGKTSTKYFLAKLLSQKYNVLMTPASYNTTMGVVKVIREMLKPSHEVFICEMGARRAGEIKEICDIVLPTHGIITSIGPQHLETFGSIENIISTKFELADAVGDSGFVLLNGDNRYIYERRYSKKYHYYGMENPAVDYFAENVSSSVDGTSFVLHLPQGDSLQLNARLIGKHNVLNIIAASAMASMLGVEPRDIVRAVKMLEPVPHRLQMVDGGDVVIIDDAFNSNPVGAKSALEALSGFDGLRVLVTPGMVELGESQNILNRDFGAHAAEVCNYIYIVGKVNYNSIYEGAASTGFDVGTRVIGVDTPEQAIAAVRALNTDRRKYVLLENDLPDNFR
ncbi:MAG: UDP-N-acetylmuramoyl-tripeptide--D-alanyl-D-alanine ligase [Eubacteriales bacterium]